ncbi:MAG TPA: molybdenum cofactor guanylyltransferase [Tissierellaceae bacterium]|nr:molybdenum cofactor guanylyltransferase [Tissierellaceae bacterium]
MKEFGTAIILAGGRSSRMGFDKQFLELGEERLILSVIQKLQEEFDEFIIVTNKPENYKDFPYKILTDKIIGGGPLSGIHSGLSESNSKHNFIIACDMPNINLDYIGYMKSCIKETDYDGCITMYKNWIEPFNSFYSKNLVDNLEETILKREKKIYPFLKNHNIFYIEEDMARKYTPNWEIFLNLNTQEDLDEYLSV